MERNNCLNLIKCFACIGVVFIHITFPGTVGNIVKYISVWAVPLFIMIAGYYSYGCDEKKILKRFKKSIKILLFGCIVFLVYNLAMALVDGYLAGWFVGKFDWKTPIWFLIFCTINWAIPLWYLIAMAETYLLWFIIVRHQKQDIILRYIWVLFAVGTLLRIFVETKGLDWSYKTNFVCCALPWFLFGYLIKEKFDSKIDKIKNLQLYGLIIIGWVITLSAILLNTKINYSYIGVLLTAPAIFILGIKNSDIEVCNSLIHIGDKYSLYIYIFHVPVSGIISIMTGYLCIEKNELYFYIHPILTLITTILFAICFEKIVCLTNLKRYLT